MNELNQPARGYEEIIRRLNVAREAQGIRFEDLANKAQIGENTVRQLLHGRTVTTYTMFAVIKALGLEIQVI